MRGPGFVLITGAVPRHRRRNPRTQGPGSLRPLFFLSFVQRAVHSCRPSSVPGGCRRNRVSPSAPPGPEFHRPVNQDRCGLLLLEDDHDPE
jgi:hypothetical protein